MQYAIINGEKRTAEPSLKATCGNCSNPVNAKCGTKMVWHWAHFSTKNCDDWYEPETIWHRDWKKHFGINCSEISIIKEGVKHIADILTKDNLVIEFQNSKISAETIIERELFYNKMLWVVNGEHFKDNLTIWETEYFEHWFLKMEESLEFYSTEHHRKMKVLLVKGLDIKHSEIRLILEKHKFVYNKYKDMFWYDLTGHYNSFTIQTRVQTDIYKLYEENKPEKILRPVTFEWKRVRKSWMDAKCPVFIDLNNGYLLWIKKNIGLKEGEGYKVDKAEFLKKYAKI